jgi:hypothetical protein
MTEPEKKLAEYAISLGYPTIRAQGLTAPNFRSPEPLVSWEWYLDEEVMALWPLLSMESRWVAFIGAWHRLRVDNEVST